MYNFLRRKCASDPRGGDEWADLQSRARVGLITGEISLRGFFGCTEVLPRRTLGDRTPTIISISKLMSV